MSLFSNSSESVIYSVKAGRTDQHNSTDNKLIISANPVKGLLCMSKTNRDEIHVNLIWQNRETNHVDWSIPMLRDHKIFEVNSGKPEEHLICYQTPDSNYIFWIQDPGVQVSAVVGLIRSQIGKCTTGKTVNQGDIQQALRELGVKQESTPAPPIRNEMMQYEMIQQQMKMSVPPLSTIITKENILPLLEDEEVVNRLIALLPEKQQNKEELITQITCPQFIQCLNKLTYSVDNLGFVNLVTQYGYEPEAASESIFHMNIPKALIDVIMAKINKEKH